MVRRRSSTSKHRSLSSDVGKFAKFFVKPTRHERELKKISERRKRELEKAKLRARAARRKMELRMAKLERKRRAGVAKAVARIRKRTKIEYG